MPKSLVKFDDFIHLMKKNWPSAYQGLFFSLPRIERIGSHIDLRIGKLMADRGLITSDFHLITAIRRSNPTPPYELMPSELCNYMLFSWGGLTKVMKRLEDKGIITRISSCHDKRIRMIRLTDEGLRIVDDSVAELQEVHQQLLAGFTLEEIALLDKLLGKLLDNIESQ